MITAEPPAQTWFDEVSTRLKELDLSPIPDYAIKRDPEGGIIHTPIVKVSAGVNFYAFSGHPDSFEGPGSLTGTCVWPAYIGLETFKKVLDVGILPVEQYHEDWPHNILDFATGRHAWTYHFEGCPLTLANPIVKRKKLGYINEEDFRRAFPNLTNIFDQGYERRLWA